ncbi:MAG: NUDIX domain-containing protein [Candidatus Nanosalina sp.]
MPDFHVVAANLIERNGEYLLVQEGKEHIRGQWNVPAGSIKDQEKVINAAIREASEEAGIEVEPESLVGVFFDQSDYLDATVLVFVVHSEIKNLDYSVKPESDEEILDAGFFTKKEIQEKDLRTPFIPDSIEKLENGETCSLDTVTDYR